MPRRKLSEYRAKKLIYDQLGLTYVGWSIDATLNTKKVSGYGAYVVKVDQAIKGRFKKGLVALNVPQAEVVVQIKNLAKKGYSSFIVEPYVTHDGQEERYISITHSREGYRIMSSELGGVDVEKSHEKMVVYVVDEHIKWDKAVVQTGLQLAYLKKLIELCEDEHLVSIEINPYIVSDQGTLLLDAAIEVDDAGEYFAHGWTKDDIRSSQKTSVAQERIMELNAQSPASFNLTVLNPNGSLFLLLSGGGASIVIADEIYNHGFGKEIANYGEYSGNPTRDETHTYAREFFDLVFASTAYEKRVFIGGAVANFTDIAMTFAGIIDAINERASELNEQDVKVFVRRGGPNEQLGLTNITQALDKHGILGGVYGPNVTISDAVSYALEGMKHA